MRRFSTTAINRLVSSIRAANAKESREQLILQSESTQKELPITYELQEVNFNPETRITDIKILSIKKYRTIERYVTQNYTRYPIYSHWKTKTTNITKHLKLTNQNLEHLNLHEDSLIRKFASSIILSLHDETCIPSWLAKQIVDTEYLEILKEYNIEIGKLDNDFKYLVSYNTEKINSYNNKINSILKEQEKINRKIHKLQKKLSYIDNHNCSVLLAIITLGIYHAYCSKKRAQRLQNKLSDQQHEFDKRTAQINKHKTEIEQTLTEQDKSKIEKNSKVAEIRRKITALQKKHDADLLSIKPLSSHINTTDFIPLKTIMRYEYEKIIGCYIIHNTENNKNYVGQSKDVLKRLKQHFHGTTPNNIIFAEDYYGSLLPNKEDLFTVQIIPLETKDELDRTEAKLIDEYEARTKGYNSTKGNS